jgi:hypothetical protein
VQSQVPPRVPLLVDRQPLLARVKGFATTELHVDAAIRDLEDEVPSNFQSEHAGASWLLIQRIHDARRILAKGRMIPLVEPIPLRNDSLSNR